MVQFSKNLKWYRMHNTQQITKEINRNTSGL